jgi:hypothetical protein
MKEIVKNIFNRLKAGLKFDAIKEFIHKTCLDQSFLTFKIPLEESRE